MRNEDGAFIHEDGTLIRCYCPGDCACRPRFTNDYRAVSPPCGCRQHVMTMPCEWCARIDGTVFRAADGDDAVCDSCRASALSQAGTSSPAMLAALTMALVPVTLLTVFVARLAGAVAGVSA